jgi:hypothetical protein
MFSGRAVNHWPLTEPDGPARQVPHSPARIDVAQREQDSLLLGRDQDLDRQTRDPAEDPVRLILGQRLAHRCTVTATGARARDCRAVGAVKTRRWLCPPRWRSRASATKRHGVPSASVRGPLRARRYGHRAGRTGLPRAAGSCTKPTPKCLRSFLPASPAYRRVWGHGRALHAPAGRGSAPRARQTVGRDCPHPSFSTRILRHRPARPRWLIRTDRLRTSPVVGHGFVRMASPSRGVTMGTCR